MVDIEDICMQLSLRKTIRNIFSIFLVLITTSSCIDNSCYYKLGKPYFLKEVGVRFLKSDDGLNTEIDGFEMDEKTIKKDIWEKEYYISRNEIHITKEMSFFKEIISVSPEQESTYYDGSVYEKKYPQKHTHLMIPFIDYIGRNSEQLNFCCPKEIIINIYLENDFCNILATKKVFICHRLDLDFVVTDKKNKQFFDSHFYEKYPNWEEIQNVVFTINIWPLDKNNFILNSDCFLEKWNEDHFKFTYPSNDLCLKIEPSIYYHRDKNIYLQNSIY